MPESTRDRPESLSALDEVLSSRYCAAAPPECRGGPVRSRSYQRKAMVPRSRRTAEPEYEYVGGVWPRRLCTAACLLFSVVCFVYGSPLRGELASLLGTHTPKATAARRSSSTATATTTTAATQRAPNTNEEIISIGGVSYRAVRKNIEDVRLGDTVLAQNPETGELTMKPVSQAFRRVTDHLRILEIAAADGKSQTIETTDEHPFWVNGRGWVKASQLAAGDTLRQSDGQFATVASSRRDEHPEGVPVYNFEVQDLHNYFVARSSDATPVLAHNANCGALSLGQEALEHIVQRHWPTSGAAGAGKFAQGISARELRNLITEAAANGARRPGNFGRTLIEHDFGRIIGIEIGGAQTGWLRVVIDPANNVITAFPF